LSFDDDTALRPASEPNTWHGEIADGWQTPRGPLGGYVMAIVLRGMELTIDDDERQARSMTMHFLRVPERGPVTVRAELERAGRSLSTVSARLEQEDRLLGLAIAAFSKPWEGPVLDDAAMPSVEPPERGREPVMAGPPREGGPPPFMARLTMQSRFGEPAFSRADHGEVGGWLGLAEERAIDSLSVAVLADAWFPAPWPRLAELAPAPTIDLTVHFRSALPIDDTLLLGRFRNRYVRDGFFEEDGELWAPDGTLIAQSRQLGLLLGAQA
jgi:acyl-CoA thioesterase